MSWFIHCNFKPILGRLPGGSVSTQTGLQRTATSAGDGAIISLFCRDLRLDYYVWPFFKAILELFGVPLQESHSQRLAKLINLAKI